VIFTWVAIVLQAWEGKLRGLGYRVTAPRRAVLRALARAHRPLSVAELHKRGRAQYACLGLVTVYRTLQMLERVGLARRIHAGGACRSFVASTPGHSHTITCEHCEKTAEFDGDDVCLLPAGLEERTGYRVSGHWLQLVGVCRSCRASGD
jgi:Fur family ferric uptake transcriptional regulator